MWVDDADALAERAVKAGGSLVAEPFDSLDGGRMAIVADPAGAVFGVWQLGEHRGARVVNEPGAWAMSALITTDPEGAKRFYGDVFGWTTSTSARRRCSTCPASSAASRRSPSRATSSP